MGLPNALDAESRDSGRGASAAPCFDSIRGTRFGLLLQAVEAISLVGYLSY
jgi:hypothetical protein